MQYSTIKSPLEFKRIMKECNHRVQSTSFIALFNFLENEPENTKCQFGITVSKKIGNAVTRNKQKRRIRNLLRDVTLIQLKQPVELVVIARVAINRRTFSQLKSEIKFITHKVNEEVTSLC
jgi:ribonuclease P protein component